jgi:hypothetical protein
MACTQLDGVPVAVTGSNDATARVWELRERRAVPIQATPGDANDVNFSCGRDLICVEPLQESVARGTRAHPLEMTSRSSVRVRAPNPQGRHPRVVREVICGGSRSCSAAVGRWRGERTASLRKGGPAAGAPCDRYRLATAVSADLMSTATPRVFVRRRRALVIRVVCSPRADPCWSCSGGLASAAQGQAGSREASMDQ